MASAVDFGLPWVEKYRPKELRLDKNRKPPFENSNNVKHLIKPDPNLYPKLAISYHTKRSL